LSYARKHGFRLQLARLGRKPRHQVVYHVSKRGPNKRKRVPKLSFAETVGIGWRVLYRYLAIGSSTRRRFSFCQISQRVKGRSLLPLVGIIMEIGPLRPKPTGPPKNARTIACY